MRKRLFMPISRIREGPLSHQRINRTGGDSPGEPFLSKQHVDSESVVHILSTPVRASGVRVDVDLLSFVLSP